MSGLAHSQIYRKIALFMDARIYEAGVPAVYLLSVVASLVFMWSILRRGAAERFAAKELEPCQTTDKQA